MSLLNAPSVWVDSNEQLAECCQQWSTQAAIAVDTEFMRTSTFYPIAGLIQIGDGRQTFLVDPLAITDFGPLADLLANPAVVKVFHACSEDLEVFSCLLNVCPSPIFDTQVAAAYLGAGLSVGYATLLEQRLSIVLEKGETRSDWLQRPLTASQKEYAALDVAHLLIIYGKLLSELKTTDRLRWVQDDCAELRENYFYNAAAENFYLRIKNAWRLSPTELKVLREVSLWREQVARDENVPRNRVIKEHVLVTLAKKRPRNMGVLSQVEGIPGAVLRERGDDILAAVENAMADTDPLPRLPGPLPSNLSDLVKSLKHLVQETADSLGVPAALLASKKDYDFLVRQILAGDAPVQLSPRLAGWRKAVIGDSLRETIEAYRRND